MTSFQTKPLRTLYCINGIVELYSNRLTVRKKGRFSRFSVVFSDDNLTISLYQLGGVELYPGVMLANGVLRLMTPKGNVFLFFTHKTYPQVQAMKDTIEDLLSRQRVFPELKDTLLHRT